MQELTAYYLIEELLTHSNEERAENMKRFFKAYDGAFDTFIGVSVPQIRVFIKPYISLALEQVLILLKSEVHEIRMSGLLILVKKFKKQKDYDPKEIYNFYLGHLQYVNNWDLVDCSATAIVGAYLYQEPKVILFELAKSPNYWTRRVAIVAMLYEVRKRKFDDAIALCRFLSKDEHEMVQKAVGWVLRECIKKGENTLETIRPTLQEYPKRVISIAIQELSKELKSEIRASLPIVHVSKKISH